MAQEVIDWKFNKIRLANWSGFRFCEINGSNEQPNLDQFDKSMVNLLTWSKVNMLTDQRSKVWLRMGLLGRPKNSPWAGPNLAQMGPRF